MRKPTFYNIHVITLCIAVIVLGACNGAASTGESEQFAEGVRDGKNAAAPPNKPEGCAEGWVSPIMSGAIYLTNNNNEPNQLQTTVFAVYPLRDNQVMGKTHKEILQATTDLTPTYIPLSKDKMDHQNFLTDVFGVYKSWSEDFARGKVENAADAEWWWKIRYKNQRGNVITGWINYFSAISYFGLRPVSDCPPNLP